MQPLKNFPSFYGTRRFNTVFTRALHWSLSSVAQNVQLETLSNLNVLMSSENGKLWKVRTLFKEAQPFRQDGS
jgi:hypothetical protein